MKIVSQWILESWKLSSTRCHHKVKFFIIDLSITIDINIIDKTFDLVILELFSLDKFTKWKKHVSLQAFGMNLFKKNVSPDSSSRLLVLDDWWIHFHPEKRSTLYKESKKFKLIWKAAYTVKNSESFPNFVLCVIFRKFFSHKPQKIWKKDWAGSVRIDLVCHILYVNSKYFRKRTIF